MTVGIVKLKKQLMERINTEDLIQVEKVERYINMVESFRRVNQIVEDEGESVITENGAQRFTKAHPLIGERNKINASLLNIEKSFGFDADDSKKEEGYTKDDLT